jgi:hypothetical protein
MTAPPSRSAAARRNFPTARGVRPAAMPALVKIAQDYEDARRTWAVAMLREIVGAGQANSPPGCGELDGKQVQEWWQSTGRTWYESHRPH